MGFFSKAPDMARETPQPPASPTAENPEPARPGTSGTEMLLVNNRRRATQRYKDAQKKERDYKTKKRSASARTNYTAAVCFETRPTEKRKKKPTSVLLATGEQQQDTTPSPFDCTYTAPKKEKIK